MSIFLTDTELLRIKQNASTGSYTNLFWGMLNRVQKYCTSPGQTNFSTSTEWWHNATEYLTEAAWVYKVKPNYTLEKWLRGATLDLVRSSDDDWIGPFFRNRNKKQPQGYLETAHLSIAVSIVFDLCPEIFSGEESEEIKNKLKNTAIPLCQSWLKNIKYLNNWYCILLAGVAVPAAVLQEQEVLKYVFEQYKFCVNIVQPDGSYSESLQYSNYCFWGLMYIYESLTRSNPDLEEEIKVPPYAKAVKWFIHSFFYKKPLEGWGVYPIPRSANFNDSAAIFGADPDLLMHIAARLRHIMPEEAGLAKWLFNKLYIEFPGQGPFDRNTFGFFNRYSFFSMIFYPQSADVKTPDDIKLPLAAYYSNGDCLTRNSWTDYKTVLAFKGAPQELNGPGHLHADLNSFILVHNKERLLVDPGHSCYRNLIHEYEVSTKAHNTCTFTAIDKQGSLIKPNLIQQGVCRQRKIKQGRLEHPVYRPAKHLINRRIEDITIFGADAAGAYGNPIILFERFTVLCGEHIVFVIDRIKASQQVVTRWNWLLNNRDNQLEYKLFYPDRLVARRGNAGMKLFHLGNASLTGPFYGYVHDAYHPLPKQLGEGAPGSGLHFVWQAEKAQKTEQRIHAIALDEYGSIINWHLANEPDGSFTLKNAEEFWNLNVLADQFIISEKNSKRIYQASLDENKWNISKL